MRRWLWRDGRLGWPLMALLVFSTLWVLGFDYAWRMINMSFAMLLAVGLAVWFSGCLILLWFSWHMD